jgi:hypothetical protein
MSAISESVRREFLAWLLMPDEDRHDIGLPTQQKFAYEHGVNPRDLTKLRNDPDFIVEWNREFAITIGNPGRKLARLEVLHQTAIDPDDPAHVRATKTYHDIEQSLKPPPVQHVEVKVERRPLEELSDEELAAIKAMYVKDELEARRDRRSA